MRRIDRAAGSVVGGRQLTGTNATFADPVPSSLLRNGQLDLELFVVDEGGNIARLRDTLRLIQ